MTRSTSKTAKRVAPSKSDKGKTKAQRAPASKLLVAMNGKASAAKAAEGDAPVFAYIASLPQRAATVERCDSHDGV